MYIDQKEIFKIIDDFKEIYLKEIRNQGKDILLYGSKREKTSKGYEITLCEGFPTVKIGTTKIGVYLKIQFYNNISITDIMYSQACSHTLKLLKAINEDLIEYGQERW